MLTCETISKVCGCDLGHVQTTWPVVQKALADRGFDSEACEIAAVATIAVETAYRFLPIHEFGGDVYFTRLYEHRADLGNTEPGDGARFHGRGLAQLTGRDNYRRFGMLIGVDLIANPDAALDPSNAAKIFVEFFSEKHIATYANALDWARVRRNWNGGMNGWSDFSRIVAMLRSMP